MITGRELAHFDYRMARIEAREAALAQPRQLLQVTAKSAGAPGWLFARPDISDTAPAAKLSRPYALSPWIQRAINLKAGEISAVPVKFYEGDREYSTPEFEAFWAAPFITYDRRRLSLGEGQLQLVGWLDLRGKFFILRGDDWLVPFPDLKEAGLSPLVIARPDRMRPVVRGGAMVGWEFTDAAGRRWPLLPEQVDCVSLWNPYDEKDGLAPIESVFLAAESDYLAGLYTRNLMRNNGDQGVYVIAKGGVPSDPQREQIVEQLRDKRRASLRGDFRPVFLTGDISIEDAKAQIPDANLNATRLLDRHTVFIGLGVPGSMADVQAAYSIGSDSDRARLITGTCQSLARVLNSPIGRIASTQTGRMLSAESDWDEHPVMQAIRRERIAAAKDLWDRGMSWKDINDFLDLGMKPFRGWEISYMPFSVAPVESGAMSERAPESDPSLAEAEDDPEMRRVMLGLLGRQRVRERMRCEASQTSDPKLQALPGDPFAMFACACGSSAGVEMKARDKKEIAQWRDSVGKRRSTVKAFEGAFGRVLTAARVETLRKVAAYDPNGEKSFALVGKAAAVDLLFNLANFATSFGEAMGRQQRVALNTAGKQLFAEVGKDDPFAYPPAEVLNFLAGRKNNLRDVPSSIFEEIKATIDQGLIDGDTAEQLSARVRQAFNGVSSERARRIALTETGAAYGAGRDEAMKQAGVQWKQWLTSGNANVRAAHAEANGQTVRFDEPFTVDGESLMFPGDDAGSPGNVINCHCVSIAVAEAPDE